MIRSRQHGLCLSFSMSFVNSLKTSTESIFGLQESWWSSLCSTISSPVHTIRTAVSSIMSPGKKGPDHHTNVFSNLTARVFLNRCTRDELNHTVGIQRYWVRSCRAYVKYIICQANRNVALRIIMVFMCLRQQHFTGFESLYGCNSTSFHVNWKYIQ